MRFIDVFLFVQQYAHKTLANYRAKGLWRTIFHGLRWLVFKQSEDIFVEQDLADFSIIDGASFSEEFLKMTTEDVEEMPHYYDGWFNKVHAQRRIDRGHMLFCIKRNGVPVYFRWVEIGKGYLPDADLCFALPDSTAYMAYSYTVPEYRNQGLAFAASRCTLQYLKARGFLSVFAILSKGHDSVIRLAKKLGYNKYQCLSYKRFFLFLRYYSVKDHTTGQRKVFWRVPKTDHEIWNTFSKIYHA